jgi:hypothetical protein
VRFVGFSPRDASGPDVGLTSDLAFQGKTAYQGTFDGFRIVDIANPSKPEEIVDYTGCRHPSGQAVSPSGRAGSARLPWPLPPA